MERGDICFFWDDVDLEELIEEPESYSNTVDRFSHVNAKGQFITENNYHFDYCIKLTTTKGK